MKAKFVLAIDQGTTNTKVLLIDRGGAIAARASRPLEIRYPQPAWVEQDARALWRSVVDAARECLDKTAGEVAGIGVSNQRESVIVWDRATGEPAGPCVVWQCRRTAQYCVELQERGLGPLIERTTGLAIDPLFSASKMRWLLDHIDDGQRRAEDGALCAGTVDSWVLWNLTGGAVHACDATNAARTQLFDLRRLAWHDELLRVFGIPAAILPEVRRSSAAYGMTAATGLPAGLPIGSLIGDSHAALFGHAAFQPGSVKATYGTGSSLMTLTEGPALSERGLSSTIAWWHEAAARYALEGNITVTGGAMQWVGELLGLADGAQGAAALGASVADTGGVYLTPAFAGLGAPYWDPAARGAISGLTRGSNSAHVARAALESIAYQVVDVFDAMEADAGGPCRSFSPTAAPARTTFSCNFRQTCSAGPCAGICRPICRPSGQRGWPASRWAFGRPQRNWKPCRAARMFSNRAWQARNAIASMMDGRWPWRARG